MIVKSDMMILGKGCFTMPYLEEESCESVYSSTRCSSTGIPLLSFFAGAGFLDIGFLQAGFDIIWRNENNPSFVKGFEYAISHMNELNQNGNGKVHNIGSIMNITANDIAREAFHNLPRPEMFGIIGGPPCPDFSTGGKNRGREGDHGRLSQVYVSMINDLQPTFFLFENVPGLLRTKKHKQFLYELMNQLSEKYFIDLDVLNALEYGVPQDRERLFLIGFQKNWIKHNMGFASVAKCKAWETILFSVNISDYKIHQKERWFPWPEQSYEQAKVRYTWPEQSPFGGEPEKPANIPDELMIGSFISNQDELSSLPNGLEKFEPRSEKFRLIAEGDVSRKSFKRLHRWRYSPAAAYGNNEVHLHPTQPRRLTVREALKIQTVPDSYAFPQELPLSHKFKMIGNGVPIKLAEAIAASFAKFLISHE
jgi:DNA (cytosine-5)-methyltransferase 1